MMAAEFSLHNRCVVQLPTSGVVLKELENREHADADFRLDVVCGSALWLWSPEADTWLGSTPKWIIVRNEWPHFFLKLVFSLNWTYWKPALTQVPSGVPPSPLCLPYSSSRKSPLLSPHLVRTLTWSLSPADPQRAYLWGCGVCSAWLGVPWSRGPCPTHLYTQCKSFCKA